MIINQQNDKGVDEMVKWLSIPAYSKTTGLSKSMIKNMISEGKLITEYTDEGGQVRIKHEVNPDLENLQEKLDTLTLKFDKLCQHLGVR